MALVKTHPDAERVTVLLEGIAADTTVEVDTKQVERAVYNLLLNACQSARREHGAARGEGSQLARERQT
jgi:signal transduction histidine kinase